MEVNRFPSNEKVDAPPKPYNCAFCKKGFSSAQALGGHMNIHRKDRAKLRQSFDQSVGSNHKTTIKGSQTKPCTKEGSHNHLTKFSEEGSTRNFKTPCSSLFIEEIDDGDPNREEPVVRDITVSSSIDLDLELRLGHDPNHMKHRG